MSCELEGEYSTSILPTKLVAPTTTLEGSKKITSIVQLRPKFYQSCKFREDPVRCVEVIDLTEVTAIFLKQQQNISPHRAGEGGGLKSEQWVERVGTAVKLLSTGSQFVHHIGPINQREMGSEVNTRTRSSDTKQESMNAMTECHFFETRKFMVPALADKFVHST